MIKSSHNDLLFNRRVRVYVAWLTDVFFSSGGFKKQFRGSLHIRRSPMDQSGQLMLLFQDVDDHMHVHGAPAIQTSPRQQERTWY